MENCKRKVTNDDIKKYEPLVEKYIRDSVKKNWNESYLNIPDGGEIFLGNTGWTLKDMRQYLRTEIVVALQNYNPDKNTKESTFVFGHLYKRIGSLMKKLTRSKHGYSCYVSNIEEVQCELDRE